MFQAFYTSLKDVVNEICSGEISFGNTTIIYVNREVYQFTTINISIITVSIILLFIGLAILAFCLWKKKKENTTEEMESASPLDLSDIEKPTTYDDLVLFNTSVRDHSSNGEEDFFNYENDIYDGNPDFIQQEDNTNYKDYFGITVQDPEPDKNIDENIEADDFFLNPIIVQPNIIEKQESIKEIPQSEKIDDAELEKAKEEKPQKENTSKKKTKRRRAVNHDKTRSTFRSLKTQAESIMSYFERNAAIRKGLIEDDNEDKTKLRDVFINISKSDSTKFDEMLNTVKEFNWQYKDRKDNKISIKIDENASLSQVTDILKKAFDCDPSIVIAIKKKTFNVEEDNNE